MDREIGKCIAFYQHPHCDKMCFLNFFRVSTLLKGNNHTFCIILYLYLYLYKVSPLLCPPASPFQKTSTLCMHNICTSSQRSLPSLPFVPTSPYSIFNSVSSMHWELGYLEEKKPLKMKIFFSPKTLDIPR